MEKKNKRNLILSIIICLLPMILGIVFYNQLPEQMPIHFTINDVPDNYAPKNFALFGIPAIMAILQAICMFSTANKLKNKEKPIFAKIMEWVIPIVTVLVYIIMLQVSLGSDVYVGKSICLIVGILFIIMGNYLPKMSYDTAKGIVHPIPSNEKAFRKISKIMGYALIALGIVSLLLIIWV